MENRIVCPGWYMQGNVNVILTAKKKKTQGQYYQSWDAIFYTLNFVLPMLIIQRRFKISTKIYPKPKAER